ncbi:MAG: hypothetical protein M3Y87_02030, partial [Myxococcota bacterium]|nr:hypothetical protein [Myxococcota bacterium]
MAESYSAARFRRTLLAFDFVPRVRTRGSMDGEVSVREWIPEAGATRRAWFAITLAIALCALSGPAPSAAQAPAETDESAPSESPADAPAADAPIAD